METRHIVVRNLDDLGGIVTHTNREQTPIPWCTKHNQKASKNRDGEWTCWHWRAKNCEWSLGGPDHKWWKDI